MRIEGSAVLTTTPGEALSDEAIDHVLHALTEAACQVEADYVAAVRLRQELYESDERGSRLRATQTWPPAGLRIDPLESLGARRTLLAEETAEKLEDAVTVFAAWYADVAACAVVAQLVGTGLTPVRVAAADPYTHMDERQLALLPAISETDRELAELAVWMDEGLTDVRPGDRGPAPVGGRDFAAELGMVVRRTPDGRPVLVQDGWTEARRRRLWGRMWLDHQMPLLPPTGELVHALDRAGAAPGTVEEIRQASQAVDAALGARMRAHELNARMESVPLGEGLADSVAELDAEAVLLWRQADELPHLLIAYARVLTGNLPRLRLLRRA
ncbi:hypothetical protein ABZ470_01560 [Streptosporangium sp. NPDC020072]|uniref:Uncharacterized protein n=1 Tax=Streptosporangium jomthongense TaxID=1193683 RepID=A0ABV8ETY8_9ACTN